MSRERESAGMKQEYRKDPSPKLQWKKSNDVSEPRQSKSNDL